MNCNVVDPVVENLIAQQIELQNHIIAVDSRLKKIETELPALRGFSEDVDRLTQDVADLNDAVERQNTLEAGAKVAGTENTSGVVNVDTPVPEVALHDALDHHQADTLDHGVSPDGVQSFDSKNVGKQGKLQYVYVLEENLYSVIFVSPFWWPVLLVFCFFYITALGIICVINTSVGSTYQKRMKNLASICSESEDGGFDCRPASYVQLLDFATLDTNADGEWSMEEAEERGMLQQFEALQTMVLETPKLLTIAAPSRNAAKNLFCSYAMDDPWGPSRSPAFHEYISNGLTCDEQVTFANASGPLSSSKIQQCRDQCTPQGDGNGGGHDDGDVNLDDYGFGDGNGDGDGDGDGDSDFDGDGVGDGNGESDGDGDGDSLFDGDGDGDGDDGGGGGGGGGDLNGDGDGDGDGDIWHLRCLAEDICNRLDNVWHLDFRARSSREEYLLKTKYLTIFPQSIFDLALRSIELPCRLVEPQLCSNTEFAGNLSSVPQWEGLSPKDRIHACESFVTTTCSEIFGSSYSRLHADTSTVCGEAKLSPESVAPLPPKLQIHSTACVDNDTLARETVAKLLKDNPFFQYVTRGVTNVHGKQVLLDNATCSVGNTWTWCHDITEVIVDPANPTYRERVSSIFGKACPETCCRAHALGCPGICLADKKQISESIASDTSASLFMKEVMAFTFEFSLPEKQTHGNFDQIEMSFGSVQCVGSFCSWLNFAEGSPRSLTLECPVLLAQASAKIVLHKDRAVYITVSKFQGDDALETAVFGQAPGCVGAYLEIDGARYCGPDLPKGTQFYLPLNSGPVHEIVFATEQSLPSYESVGGYAWSFTIRDAAEFGDHGISTVQFLDAQKTETFASWDYKIFISLIYFLWTSFVLVEIHKAFQMMQAILCCPAFQGSRIRRRLMLVPCVLRLVMDIWMFVVGCILLAAVPDYIDVVLNSVALAFIFEFDEVLYSIAIPISVKRKISATEPYRWGSFKPRGYKVTLGLSVPALVAFTLVVFQNTWRYGSSQINEQMSCACHLQGAECVDAVFRL